MTPQLSEKKLNNFKGWLTAQGAEILPGTNEFEVLRFRCKTGTGVIYAGRRGLSVNTEFVNKAIDCFLSGKQWSGKGKPGKRINGSRKKRQVIDRDGDGCFYCGKGMAVNEMTLEHLLSVNQGGPTRMENLVMACRECNLKAGHLPIIEKVKLRDKLKGIHNAKRHTK